MKHPHFLFENNIKNTGFSFESPVHEVVAHHLDDVVAAFETLQQLQKRGLYLAGFVSYEAGWAFAAKNFTPTSKEHFCVSIPLLHFCAFAEKRDVPEKNKKQTSKIFFEDWQSSRTEEEYVRGFNKIQEHLEKGNTYQINYTFFEKFKCSATPDLVYQKICELQKTQYSAFLQYDEYRVLSFSPELFLQKKGSQLICEPMKGTVAATGDKNLLTGDEKMIAENLMIVDLIRNDLGRIARPGTVHVEELFHVKTLETVHQMVSKVTAQVEDHVGLLEIFKSLFPCGSITGAPKQSSMKVISEVESWERGIYTGAIGYVEPSGDFCFNVAIRTHVESEGSYSYGIGGGVLVDSDVKKEFEEAKLKSLYLRKVNSSFHLFETVYYDGQQIKNISAHLQRLQQSAEYFGFFFESEKIQGKLADQLQTQSQPCKIKICLYFDGDVQVECTPLLKVSSDHVRFSMNRVDSQNIFQKHKTSERNLYDKDYQQAAGMGLYDFLYLNEKDELVEASRHNVFLKLDNVWKTPSLSSGCLPGIERAQLLYELKAQECSLNKEDVERAEQILLTNSVRGSVLVKLERL